MSNGVPPCCPMEICCDRAQRRARVAASIGHSTGAEIAYCEGFLDWMDEHGLVFAPKEFQAVIDAIAAMARRHPA